MTKRKREPKLGETTGVQLEHLARMFTPWRGVYMKDELTSKVHKLNRSTFTREAYIINYESTTQGDGTHWVLLLFLTPTSSYYFDSYGLPPPLEISQFIDKCYKSARNPDHVYYQRNESDVQPFKSELCGYYCLYII